MLPIPADHTVERFSEQLRNQGGLRQRENILSAREFWSSLMPRKESRREEGQRASTWKQDEHRIDRAWVIAILAGACFGLERTRQGTREEILELMESYLELRYGIHLELK